MKITPIVNNKTSYLVNNMHKNQLNVAKSLNFDTVSFGAKTLTYEELKDAKMKSYLVQEEAKLHQKDGYELKDKAQKQLLGAKKQYLNALTYIQGYFQLQQKVVDLPNGGRVEYSPTVVEKQNILEITVYDENNSPQKIIIAQNGLPSKIVNYKDNFSNIYDYSSSSITISKGLSMNMDNMGQCESIYSFVNGKLTSVNLDGNILSEPTGFDESYMYFDDKLVSFSKDNKIYSNKKYHYGERYIYLNDRLTHYYENFNGEKGSLMEWEKSFHFLDSKLAAEVTSAFQDEKSGKITPKKVIYLDDNQSYKLSNSAQILVNDFGGFTILEQR